jgi:hypothetical protein
MVKQNKKSSKGKKMSQGRKAKRVVVTTQRGGLDSYAQCYAKLLKDPCNAPLCRGIAGGSEGSVVIRMESDAILFNGATATGGTYVWVPGMIRGFSFSTALDSTGSTYALDPTLVPGYAFITTTTASMRALSACMQVMFPGTELQRSGVVSLGTVPASSVTNCVPAAQGGAGQSTTTALVRQMSQFTERTPDTMMEITWRPGQGDGELIDISGEASVPSNYGTLTAGRNALIMSASGLPAAVGVRIRTVVVYEYTPALGQGIVATVETSPSVNSVNDVLRALDSSDARWFINGFKKVGMAVGRAGLSYVTRGISENIINTLNMSGANNRPRNYNAIGY